MVKRVSDVQNMFAPKNRMTEIEAATQENTVSDLTPGTGDEEWKKFLVPPKEAITPNDLQTCCAIIQMSSKAGVFSPSDFKTVGALYDKLSEYVQHIRAKDIDAALKTKQASASAEPVASDTGPKTEEKKE